MGHQVKVSGDCAKQLAFCPAVAIARLKTRISVRHGGRSSMVEPQIVVLVVAGSSPVDHPIQK
jgi:hypothetical protein